MTQLFSTAPLLRALNGDSLRSPKVTIVNADAFAWLEQHDEMFDAIVVDFPDPTNFSIGKLYTRDLLRAARAAPVGERLRGRADDLAADRAQELLDRGRRRSRRPA